MQKFNYTTMIGQQIRDYRKSMGITQKKLSSMTGLSQPYLSQIEDDTANPTFNVICQICTALDIKVVIKKKSSFKIVLTQEVMDLKYQEIREEIWNNYDDGDNYDEDELNRKADSIFKERYGHDYNSI